VVIAEVEKLEVGDRIELWVEDAPQAIVVRALTEGEASRTIGFLHKGAMKELSLPLGQTVNRVC
jgi:hypothetical protein